MLVWVSNISFSTEADEIGDDLIIFVYSIRVQAVVCHMKRSFYYLKAQRVLFLIHRRSLKLSCWIK